MKKHCCIVLILAGLTFNLRAQLPELSLDMDDDVSRSALVLQSEVATPAGSLIPGAFRAAELGQDFIRWEGTSLVTNRAGIMTTQTNSYIELETSKHYWRNGQWVESREEIELVANGAVARHGPHKAAFASNINSPVGVEVLTPENKRLRMRVLGMVYYDFKARTNSYVWISELKDSHGQLIATNQVLYPDAFTEIQADVRYTYRKGGLEQDVILRHRPPLPEEYGLNPVSTRLLVLTEFIDAPEDVRTIEHIRRGWRKATVDKVVSFGRMKIGHGTAFSLSGEAGRRSGVPVQKHWAVLEGGRTCLIEEVSFLRIRSYLSQLQARVSSNTGEKTLLAKHRPCRTLQLPSVKLAKASSTQSIQVAAIKPDPNGLVLDYDLRSTLDDQVLHGDTNYVVTGTVDLGGLTTIEGGTVIKYNRGAQLNVQEVKCLTGPYRPAVFTAIDDNSVGDALGTGNPVGKYADCALSLGVGGELQYCHFRYATNAIYCAENTFSVSHSQFLFCDRGLYCHSVDFGNYNVLMCQVGTNYYGTLFHGTVQHLTSDQAHVLAHDPNFNYQDWCDGLPSSGIDLANSLLVSVTNGCGMESVLRDHVRSFSTGQGIFAVALGGGHYLVSGSTNQNAGREGIYPALADALKQKTTQLPVVLSNHTLAANTTLSPHAKRDTDIPDLGYHYAPLDYLVSQASLVDGLCTVRPGTTIGAYPTVSGYGLLLGGDGNLQCRGAPDNPVRIVGVETVQEQPLPVQNSAFRASIMTYGGQPQASFQFTKWCAMGLAPQHLYGYDFAQALSFHSCEFMGGTLKSEVSSLNITNCLFERVYTILDDEASLAQMDAVFQNNLFYGGTLNLNQTVGGTWILRDNLFDQSVLAQAGTIDHAFNGYTTGSARLTPTQGSDVVGSLSYATNTLGSYYQPVGSPFSNQGSVADAASLGLFHYTTLSSEAKEQHSRLDIGYHYVACVSGKPADTDNDGLADYFEDTSGNGSFDLLVDWSNLNSVNTDNDDLNDFQEWLSGRNPRVANTVSGSGTINLRVYTPLK